MDMRNERGIALPIVIFTMVIIGAIVAGSFFLARQEARTGDNTMASATASEAAEAGINQVIANWSPTAYNGIAVGDSLVLTTTSLGGNASYTPTLSRLSPQIFLVRAVGRYQVNGVPPRSQRQIGMLARLDIPAVNMRSAITVRAGITISGSSQVSGVDSVPAGWGATCPPAGATMPGVRDSSGNVNTSGACSGASCITGSPKILVDTTITSNDFTQFGNISFSQLAAQANKLVSGTLNSIAPTTTGTPPSCQRSNILNWGDPVNPLGVCFDYFPIIYSSGDLRVSGGYGQGILLVAGDLDLSGGFEFYGPVIVQGTVTSTGTGGHIFGGLMAGNANLGTTLVSGNSVVDYSSCAIDRALQGASVVSPLGERRWSQLY